MDEIPDFNQPGFVTPGQVSALRQYAQALMGSGMPMGHSGNVTAASPWGGLSSMAGALMGGQMLRGAGDAERGSMVAGYNSNPYSGATSAQESGGNYNAIGQPTHDGDRAYGKYQVMGKNVGPWTAQILGQAMTPEQFLANPQAQEAVYNAKFGEYVQKYGPEGAAKAWFAGEHGMNDPNARAHKPDGTPFGPTVEQYGQKFAQNVGPGGGDLGLGGHALAFSGEPNQPPILNAGSPAGMSMALQAPGGMQPPAPRLAPGGAAIPQGSPAVTMPPAGALPYRVPVSREQYVMTMANPYVDPQTKQFVQQSYYSQGQPLSVPGPYGSQYVFNPQDRSQGYMLPPPLLEKTLKANGSEMPYFLAPVLPGQAMPPPALQPIIPGTQGGGMAPQQQPQGGQAQPAARPTDLNYAEKEGGAAQQGLPPIITQGPEAVKAGQPASGMLGTPPPQSALPFAETNRPEPVPGGEATPTPGPADPTRMSPAQFFEWSRRNQVLSNSEEEYNKKDIESYQKDFDATQATGRNAYNLDQQIDIAKNIIENPAFTQGPGSDLKLAMKKVWAFLGDKDSQNQLSYNDAFKKIVSSNILADMRSKLQGLGQVRLAEIKLLENASASQYNTLAANRAILDIAGRYQKQAEQMSQISNWYRQGYRWQDGKLMTDKQGNPVISNERPTVAGQDQAINYYLAHHPLFNPDEINHYMEIFKDDKGATEGTETKKSANPLADEINKRLQAQPQPQQQPAAPQIPL